MDEQPSSTIVESGDALNREKKKSFKNGVFLGVPIGLACGSVILVIVTLVTTGVIGDRSSVRLNKFSSIKEYIDNVYIFDYDEESLAESAYKGYIEGLDDPYSRYFTSDEMDSKNERQAGEYAGIGIVINGNVEDGYFFEEIYEDSPAEEAGLKVGDKLVAVDGKSASEMESTSVISENVRGDEGTTVDITYLRDGEEDTVTLERRFIILKTVVGDMLEDNIGYIRISYFNDMTYDQFVEAYETLESQGMQKVIFDVRENPGGQLSAVTQILDYILPEGDIIIAKYKDGKEEKISSTAEHSIDIPVEIIINENSASAAELFTGAIRDYDMAEVVGVTSYGKGVGQNIYHFRDGSGMQLTSFMYYLPNGDNIHEVGIEPMHVVEYDFKGSEDDEYSYDLDNQLQKAIEVIKSK